MTNRKRNLSIGIYITALVMLTSCGTTDKDPTLEPRTQFIRVWLEEDPITKQKYLAISENDRVKAVRSEQNLQWNADGPSGLESISIQFQAEILSGSGQTKCTSTGPAISPCRVVTPPNGKAPMVTCNLMKDLGRLNLPTDEDFDDYCYTIEGSGPAGSYQLLDPIVRGRR
jgi:hypothetical protein